MPIFIKNFGFNSIALKGKSFSLFCMPHINWNIQLEKNSTNFPCRIFRFLFDLLPLSTKCWWRLMRHRATATTPQARRALSFPPVGQQLVSNFPPPHFPIFTFSRFSPWFIIVSCVLALICFHCEICDLRLGENRGLSYEERGAFCVGSAFDKSGLKIQWLSNVFACTDRR